MLEHLFTKKLFLFKRLFVLLATCEDPLAWWHINERQFLNVAFLAKQVFGFLSHKLKQNECLILMVC
jgi:hypothetical protein